MEIIPTETTSPTLKTQEITEADIDRRLRTARLALETKNYELALINYLFVYDNSRGMPRYNGKRLSQFPSDIMQLGLRHPPALKALQQRRDSAEALVFSGRGGLTQLQELTALNRYIDGPDRNIELYNLINESQRVSSEVRDKIGDFVWKQLAETKRYAALESRIVKIARRVATKIMEHELAREYPGDDFAGSAEYVNYLRVSIVKDGGLAYETLLALGMDEIAESLEKRILAYQPTGHMYVTLVDHAASAGRVAIAHRLIARASSELTEEYDCALVAAAEMRLPDIESHPEPVREMDLSFSPI